MLELRDLEYVIDAHMNKARKPTSRFRGWDDKTPYYIHPVWCATMILHETSLPEEVRINGSQALLYHDVPEDTTAQLPNWLDTRVLSSIREMTFESSEDEWKNLWVRDPETRLYKIYDKTSNLLDSSWMQRERKRKHQAHLANLVLDVHDNYGDLNIIKIAGTLI